MEAESLHFSLDENQCQQDWALLLSLAGQPGKGTSQNQSTGLGLAAQSGWSAR